MATGLYSGTSGLALGVGLNRGVSGLWGGASGLINGFGGFNPASLFATGEQGAWYDPSDLTTLFQDSAGTTPVTAAGQSVGLLLDKSRGAPTTGPELIVTGQWAFALGVTESPSGTLNFPTNGATASQANRVSAGVYYRVSFTAVGTGTLNIHVGDTAAGSPDASITTSGTYSFILAADAVGTSFQFRAGSSGGFIGTVSNISVRELPGNHATQSNAAQRPTYGVVPATGRRNLLLRTEELNVSPWSNVVIGTGSTPTVTANAGVAPDGNTTADRVQFSLGGGTTTNDVSRQIQPFNTPATDHIFSIWLRSFDGVSSINMHLVGPTGGTTNIVVTGAWQRFSVAAVGSGGVVSYAIGLRGGQTPANNNTADVLAWGAQLETGSTATNYQRVVTAFDVTEAGVPSRSYLSFDGSDDGMLTGNIVPGTDKAQVFAGVRKLSDAATNTFFETGINSGTVAGTVGMFSAINGYRFRTGGTILVDPNTSTGYVVPITNVLTGIGDIAADTAILRADGVQVVSSAADQGTGSFTTQPLYIGRRAGTTLPLNGQIFGLIVRFGANLPAATITQTETWLANRVAPTVVIP